jgi:hypothetical protein
VEEVVSYLGPPRSPDLTPMEFFLWGYVKNIVYQDKTANPQIPHHHITEVTATVTKVTFVNTWHKIKYHFDVC